MDLKSRLNRILYSTGASAKKSLGQNYLISSSVLEKIIKAIHPQKEDVVVEIGSGTGFLTERLLEKTDGKVIAVELDNRWAKYLQATYESAGLRVFHEDALKIEWSQIQESFERDATSKIILCGNIPYSISSPLIERIIGWKQNIKDTVLLLQKEFATRVCAQIGSRDSNILACWVQIHGKTEILFDVGPGNFWPAPKVDSSLLRIKWRKDPLIEVSRLGLYKKLLRTAFNQRRKMISNSLSGMCSSKDELTALFRSAGVDPNLRPEALLISDWIQLANQNFETS